MHKLLKFHGIFIPKTNKIYQDTLLLKYTKIIALGDNYHHDELSSEEAHHSSGQNVIEEGTATTTANLSRFAY